MASLRPRKRADGGTTWSVLYRKAGKQTSESFDTEPQARAFIRSIDRYGVDTALTLLDAMDRSSDATLSVAEWVREHIDTLPNITAGTRSDYHAYLRRDITTDPIGQLPVDVLGKAAVEGWVRRLSERGLAGKSIRNRHALLSAALTRAVECGLRAGNPCRGVRLPKTANTSEPQFLTSGEFSILITHVDPYYQDLIVWLFGTGMRWSEATALQVRDMHLDDDSPVAVVARAWKHTDGHAPVLGPPKSAAGRRSVSLPAQLVQIARRHTAGRPYDALLFVNRDGGQIRHNTFYVREWQAAVGRARMLPPEGQRLTKRPRLHDLRHSHASALIATGTPLNIVQARLGHESITTTVGTYGHLAHDALSVAAQATALSLAEALPEIEGGQR